jgi:hypothetical protein
LIYGHIFATSEEVCTFFRGDVVKLFADLPPKGTDGSSGGFRKQKFELGKESLDGIRLGRIGCG